MYHILWPTFNDNELIIPPAYRSFLADWLVEIYECIDRGDIAISQCITAFIAEILILGRNDMMWDAVLNELLTDDDGNPLAYSEQYGKRLYKYGNQWRQTPIYAIYDHYWIMSRMGESSDRYAEQIFRNIQDSGWIFARDVSPTNIRTRMRSELMMNMAMGSEILRNSNRLDIVRDNLKATLSNTPPTQYLSAEYFRLEALRYLDAEHLFVTDCNQLLENCKLEAGFCDFNVTDKIDDYMGTKKRTARDHTVPSPLSTLHAFILSTFAEEHVRNETLASIGSYQEVLLNDPFAIPAFKIRDLEYDFGPGVTAGEVIAATLLLNYSDEV